MLKYLLAFIFLIAASAAPGDTAHPLEHYAARQAAAYSVDPVLLKAICRVESDWISRPGAAGERGVCQIKPDTVKMFCPRCYASETRLRLALDSPHTNIELAAMYLRYLAIRLNTEDPLILAAGYNGGPNGHAKYLLKVQRAMGAV